MPLRISSRIIMAVVCTKFINIDKNCPFLYLWSPAMMLFYLEKRFFINMAMVAHSQFCYIGTIYLRLVVCLPVKRTFRLQTNPRIYSAIAFEKRQKIIIESFHFFQHTKADVAHSCR